MSSPKMTRKQALDEGRQKDISEAAKESGLLIPVFITGDVWDNWIVPDEESMKTGEDQKIRLKSLLDKLLYFIRVHRQTSKSNIIYFPIPFTKGGEEKNVQLMSLLGPVESSDKRPCITIMTPEEYEAENQVM
jgi:hypothetical protein